jgi:hypothetical protein
MYLEDQVLKGVCGGLPIEEWTGLKAEDILKDGQYKKFLAGS